MRRRARYQHLNLPGSGLCSARIERQGAIPRFSRYPPEVKGLADVSNNMRVRPGGMVTIVGGILSPKISNMNILQPETAQAQRTSLGSPHAISPSRPVTDTETVAVRLFPEDHPSIHCITGKTNVVVTCKTSHSLSVLL